MEYQKDEYGITAKDGVSSRITVFSRELPPAAPVLVCMPAMGVAARFYEPLAVPFLKEGWRLATADLRGNGLSGLRPSRKVSFGYREMVDCDWPAVLERVKAIFPEAPAIILGHSLGGQLSALYAAANPGVLAGLILVAAPSVYYRGWGFPAGLGVLAGTQAACLIARVLGTFPGKKIGFGGTEARGVVCDWARQGRTGRYEPAGSGIDYESLLGDVRLPVLAFSFAGDFLAPKRAVANLCAKMPRARLEHVHLRGENLSHLTWVREPEAVIHKIREWLAGLPPPPSFLLH